MSKEAGKRGDSDGAQRRASSCSRLAVLFVVVAAAACNRTMTENDCRKVADHMGDVYDAEAKKAVPADGAATEKTTEIINGERSKLLESWAVECKKELEGRRIDSKEMDCLLKAPTIEAINKCAEL